MATITISISSALGNNHTDLTFSAADAQRIFSAWQAQVQPGGTQAQFTAWLAQMISRPLGQMTVVNEQTVVIPPAIAVTTS